MHGDEDKASVQEILTNALAPYDELASETVITSLLRLSHEQTLLIEYLTGAEQDAPLSDRIIKSVGDGIADRIRSLAALVSTRMDVSWKPVVARLEVVPGDDDGQQGDAS
jgi:hypothetical protein